MPDRFNCDCVVIGAGVIGLAIARAIGLAGYEPIIVERNRTFGTETSSRNSEVIHAGIYYPTDTKKARLCVEGRELLYRYCETHGISAPRMGKIIVAESQGHLSLLESLIVQGQANGVSDLKLLQSSEVSKLEPALKSFGGLLSPSTGVIDSHQYMLALLGEAEDNSGTLIPFAKVVELSPEPDNRINVRIRTKDGDWILCAPIVINSAGLWAQQIAYATDGLAVENIPRLYLAKGSYLRLLGKSPFQRLIYPAPEKGGLGIHATIDLGGGVRFGPNVEWLETIDPDCMDLRVSQELAPIFADRVSRYWPGVDVQKLSPDYAGVRPK